MKTTTLELLQVIEQSLEDHLETDNQLVCYCVTELMDLLKVQIKRVGENGIG